MIVPYIILTLYGTSLLLVFIYALLQLNLTVSYARHKNRSAPRPAPDPSSDLPYVTVQLPVYNELYVIERLLQCMAKLNYPRHRLEIQVLDDSTDESLELTAQLIDGMSGINIKHITRSDRTGFKAGALQNGLKTARGELIAVFDADFLPGPDWLLQTVPSFDRPEVGAVQTRWGHLNRHHSLLTRVQAFALDTHFTLEQVGRHRGGHFLNFNGTAGIWRKKAIIDAGNWSGDTLTEDLDLSYRAQFKNWKIQYLPDIVAMAELPVVMSAAKSQQFRWNKGGAENFRKMISKIWTNASMPFKSKVHASMHLLNSSVFLLVLALGLLSVPVLYIKGRYPDLLPLFYGFSVFGLSTVIFYFCYGYSYMQLNGFGFRQILHFTLQFFIFFTVALGFSYHNSVAVIEGHCGKRSDFIRTPKFNLTTRDSTIKSNKYRVSKLSVGTVMEGLLSLYFLFAVYRTLVYGSGLGDYGLLVFHVMLSLGFGYVFSRSIVEQF